MDKVFLDTNVILDYLLARTPFDAEAKRFFEAAEAGDLALFASSLTFCNMAYIVRKISPTADFQVIATDLLVLVSITPIERTTIQSALLAGYRDFEDAVQYQSALNFPSLTHFITRNKADFTETTLPILTPAEYWAI